MISQLFINRPKLAIVISLVLMLAGAIAILHCLVLARFFASRVPAPFVVGRFIGNIARVQAALVLCAWPCGAALVCGAVLFFVPAVFNDLAAKLPPS